MPPELEARRVKVVVWNIPSFNADANSFFPQIEGERVAEKRRVVG